MMRRAALFWLVLFGLVLGFPARQPRPVVPLAGSLPVDQPFPLTGGKASRLGASALSIWEQKEPNFFSIVPLSAETGKPLDGVHPLTLGGGIAYGFSRDRSQMAFISNRSEGCPAYCLRILDLHRWEELVKPIPLENSFSDWFMIPAFSENSDLIPVILQRFNGMNNEILLIDRQQDRVAARTPLRASVFQAALTPGGDLAVYGLDPGLSGAEPVLYLALFASADLHLLWEKTLPEIPLQVGGGSDHTDPTRGQYYDPAAAFSPDGGRLYLVAADQPLLVTVDFQRRVIDTAIIQPRTGWLERLLASTYTVAHAKVMNGISKMGVLSQDGSYLYVVGQEYRAVKNERGEYETEQIPLGLQIIDTRDGALVGQIDTDASWLALAQDGQTLLLRGWQAGPGGNGYAWTEAVNIETGEVIQRLEGNAYPSRLLDGSLAWLVSDQEGNGTTNLELLLPGNVRPRFQVSHTGYLDWIVIP